jgi:FkbM family methyltransferase
VKIEPKVEPDILRPELFTGSYSTGQNFSQFGEQAYIEAFFDGVKDGYAVEVGAADGVYLSNTKNLEDKGWHVLCIEPNPYYWVALLENRKLCMPYALSSRNKDLVDFHCYDRGNGDYTAGTGFETNLERLYSKGMPKPYKTTTFKLPVRTLDYCLAAADFPRVDFLSIDAEGHDMEVLKGVNLKVWKPRAIMVENWDMDTTYFADHLVPFGYSLAARFFSNELWVTV